MLHLLPAKAQGAHGIISEPIGARREKADGLCADVVIDPEKDDPVAAVKEVTCGRGADAVIVTVGNPGP